jgi:hypothetical protein
MTKKVPDIYSAIYRGVGRARGFSGLVSPLSGGDGKMLRSRLPGWTNEDHEAAAKHHNRLAVETTKEWDTFWRAQIWKKFGREPDLSDYRVSGIGRDDFDEATKDLLRDLAQRSSYHSIAARVHWDAAHRRSRFDPTKVSRRRMSRT